MARDLRVSARWGGVAGPAAEQVERVGQDGKCGAERMDGAGGAAGEIEDEGGAAGTAEGAAEDGERCLAAAFGAHELGNAGEETVADGVGGFRGDVARGDAGSAGGDDEASFGGGVAEEVFDEALVVGDGGAAEDGKAVGLELAGDGRSGFVGAAALRGGIADGDDDGRERRREGRRKFACGIRHLAVSFSVGHPFDCTNRGGIRDLMRK